MSSKLFTLSFCVVVLLITSKKSTLLSPARATRFFLTIVARKSEKRIARAGFKFLRATSVEIICKFYDRVEEFHILGNHSERLSKKSANNDIVMILFCFGKELNGQ